ncbi:MAG: winged helix-turn-helix domain-containing protein [Lachnospiraceae bacterium]|nr:winged helix-turn-helix domain-containing protein [Lachnospiraceae bacterium]
MRPGRRGVLLDGKIVAFTDRQFRLLWHLAKNPGRVFTYEQISRKKWGDRLT